MNNSNEVPRQTIEGQLTLHVEVKGLSGFNILTSFSDFEDSPAGVLVSMAGS